LKPKSNKPTPIVSIKQWRRKSLLAIAVPNQLSGVGH
jgi:hypothetical protein